MTTKPMSDEQMPKLMTMTCTVRHSEPEVLLRNWLNSLKVFLYYNTVIVLQLSSCTLTL